MRTVVLLGAGFPKVWGGKVTKEATKELLAILVNERHSENKLGLKNYADIIIELSQTFKCEDNFEAIYSILEDAYYGYLSNQKKDSHPILESLLASNTKYQVIDGEADDLFIVHDINRTGSIVNGREIIPRTLIKKLLNHLRFILNYSSEGFDNSHLYSFLEARSTIGPLRIYSLNYDMHNPKLFGGDFGIFDGFDIGTFCQI